MGGLFNSTILDVMIGLIFVYLLLAIICTSANEWIAGLFRMRAKVLKKSISQLLDAQSMQAGGDANGFLAEFYGHPLIRGMVQDDGRHFAYLPARTFSKVVMDLATAHKPGSISAADLEQGLLQLPDGDVKRALLAVVGSADGKELADAKKAIEAWFDDTMDRATGWYKRKTQVWTVIVAAIVTLLANADTTQIARRLWTDPVLRSAVVEEAKARAQKPRPSVSVEYPDADDPTNPQVSGGDASEGNTLSEQEHSLLGKLIGWQRADIDNWTWWPGLPQRLLGWTLTILAVSLGAPFWFDVLNKFMNVRSAGKSPDEVAKRPEKKKLPPEERAA
jgi:hypothetical protein